MTQQYAQVSVRILDKDYTVKCPPEERTDLLDSAEILNAKMREARDATLDMPRLILPSVQVNMRAGEKPPAEDNGVSYLKLPMDLL